MHDGKMKAVKQLSYDEFLDAKAQLGGDAGFDATFVPDWLFDFQKSLVEWAVRKGRAAIFADCGLGKTPMQLVWAENIVRKTNGRVLILTPLAVGPQTVREAEKFGIEASHCRDGKFGNAKIVVTNYERLHYFDAADFEGCVCDESSILKNFGGETRKQVTRFINKMPYRLLCTATAAPNDYIELGTSSEALGEISHTEMLRRFFKYLDDKGQKQENRLQAAADNAIAVDHASSVWDDIRIDRVLPYREAKDGEDEKHVHPLQLDVIERAVVMWSNPDEIVLTPFMGVGSEVYGALINNRRGIGIELKSSYFKQAKKNVRHAVENRVEQDGLLGFDVPDIASEVLNAEQFEEMAA